MLMSNRSLPHIILSQTLIIEGANICDISSFYMEINRVFMSGEDWQLGASLDALDDMLYGGYGILYGKMQALVIWRNMPSSRAALGIEASRAYYIEKLKHPQLYKPAPARAALERLENGGPTYFDLVLQVFLEHPNIMLRAGDN